MRHWAVLTLACSLAAMPAKAEIRSADMGGWGEAWGDDVAVDSAPARYNPTQAAPAQPLPIPPAPAFTAPSARVMNGGWGEAWGDDPAPQPVAAISATPVSEPPTTAPAPAPTQAPAPEIQPNDDDDDPSADPIHMTADQVVHDRELGIVTAQGRVEIVQRGRTLVAENVSYNLRDDVISAAGNVTLVEPTGEVLFSEYFELTGDLREGVAREIRMLLADRSRLRGASAQRAAGTRTDIEQGAYTACEPCENNPDAGPLWEAKAERITHDQETKTVEYRNAWIELGGVPILYTPYLSHPDPTVKRKSGFLAPTPGMSSNLGANVTVPYFWAIDDQQDMTFRPRFMVPNTGTSSNKKTSDSALKYVVLDGEHRWAGRVGQTRTAASLTEDRRSNDLRGHVNATGRFDVTDTWRTGYQIQRVTDDSYLRRYGYAVPGDRPWLTTRPYVEGFGGRNYAMMEGFAFQGLRPEDQDDRAPVVLPHALFSHVGTPRAGGGYFSLDGDALAYARPEGTDAGRLITRAAWNQPYVSPLGDLYTLTTSLRADGYHVRDYDHAGNSDRGSTSAGRAIPQMSLNWRMPFVNSSTKLPQVIEPMAMIAASPIAQNPDRIPNEDSLDFELDEINVMRPNRLPGYDRVEGGLRGAYGLRWSAYPWTGGYLNAQAAQGWRAKADSTFAPHSGFADNLSDYLGRVDFSPTGNVSLLNRVRLDKNTLAVRRQETTVAVGPPLLQLAASYVKLEAAGTTEQTLLPRREYVGYSASSRVSRYWSLMAGASHDLTDSDGLLNIHGEVTYSDECFAFVTRAQQYYATEASGLDGFDITFNIVFKTLAEVPLNAF